MSLQDDVICVLHEDRIKEGNAALLEVLKHSKHASDSQAFLLAIDELVERGMIRVYTPDGRRDGACSQLRIKVTPPLYRHYRLSRIGADKRRYLMSRRRESAAKQRPPEHG